MEDCLLRGDASELVSVLHHEGLSSVTLSRLDKLVTEVTVQGGCHGCHCVTDVCSYCVLFQDLRGSAVSRVLVVLKSLDILSENRDDLEMLLSHGLTAKVTRAPQIIHPSDELR